MTDPFQQLKELTNSIHPLSEEAWKDFSAIWYPFAAKRKEVLTMAGEKEKYLHFVLDGVQRVYYFDEQQREATLVFTYAPSFGGVLDAMMLQKISAYFYETLTPSQFLRASVQDVHALMQRHPSAEILIRKGVTHALSGVLERLAELQSYSAEERFVKLLNRSPHVLQLIPHKYLANYLGIDATNFSKFINRIKI